MPEVEPEMALVKPSCELGVHLLVLEGAPSELVAIEPLDAVAAEEGDDLALANG